MVRLIKTLFVLSIGSWSLAAIQELAAQQPADVVTETIPIDDLGLEDQLSSAGDLVGSETGSAGRNRAALVHRLQCWIDGSERCSVADLNDPRVMAIRRFLAGSPKDRSGTVVVRFPDQSRVEVHLARVAESDPVDWTRSAYQIEVRPETVNEPASPSGPAGTDTISDEGSTQAGANTLDVLLTWRTLAPVQARI